MGDGGMAAGKTDGTVTADERQAHPRTSVYCSGKLTTGGQTWDCEILDISVGGAKIRFPTPLDPGAELSLMIEPHGTIPGRIAWQNSQYLGVEFACDPEQTARLVRDVLENPETNKEQRHYPRTSVLWSGRLNTGARAADCRILNISARGVKVRLLEPFEPASVVSLNIDRFGEFPGDVVWQYGDFIGIRFRDDPADIAEIFGDAAPALRRTTG
jgi:hypothetical protein